MGGFMGGGLAGRLSGMMQGMKRPEMSGMNTGISAPVNQGGGFLGPMIQAQGQSPMVQAQPMVNQGMSPGLKAGGPKINPWPAFGVSKPVGPRPRKQGPRNRLRTF